MNKAQRLLKKWNYLNHRPNYKDKQKDELDQKNWSEINKELCIYLTQLAYQGKLYTKNSSGIMENVDIEKNQ